MDTEVFGVSVDSWASATAFREELGLEYALLSDWGREVAPTYRAWDPERMVATRWSYLVDKEGVIRFAQHSALDQPRDADAMMAAVEELHREP